MRGLVLFTSPKTEDAMVDFVERHTDTIKQFRVTTTESCLKRIKHLLGKNAISAIGVESGLMGGDAQVATQIVLHDVGAAFIFHDPLWATAGQADCDALLRLLNVHNIMAATNPASADALMVTIEEALSMPNKAERRKLLPSFFESLESPAVPLYKAKQNAVIASCAARATSSAPVPALAVVKENEAPTKDAKDAKPADAADAPLPPRAACVGAVGAECVSPNRARNRNVSLSTRNLPVPPLISADSLKGSSTALGTFGKDQFAGGKMNLSFADKEQFAKELFATPSSVTPAEPGAGAAALSMLCKAHKWKARATKTLAEAAPILKEASGPKKVSKQESGPDSESFKKRMGAWKANAPVVEGQLVEEEDLREESLGDQAGDMIRAKQMRCLALVSHNNMKAAMQDFVKKNAATLRKFRLTGTNSTMTMLKSVLGEESTVFGPTCSSGPLGGDAELIAQMCVHGLGGVVFFTDPLEPHPHTADIAALIRMANLHNVLHASNPTTANALTHVLAKGLDDPSLIPTFFTTSMSPAIPLHQAEMEELASASKPKAEATSTAITPRELYTVTAVAAAAGATMAIAATALARRR